MNKPNKKKSVTKTPASESITFSVRLAPSELETIESHAATANHSVNQFIVQSALGCCEMIDAKTDDEVQVPKVVYVADRKSVV